MAATTPSLTPSLDDFSSLLDAFLFETDACLTVTRCAGAFPHAPEASLVGQPLRTIIGALSDGAARHAIASLVEARRTISRLHYCQNPVAGSGDDYEISVQPLFSEETFSGVRGIISPVPKRPRADIVREVRADLLASVSHELRTPLNAILGFAEIIRSELLGPLGTPRYREYVADIEASGRHLLRMVDDVLDIARLEGGDVVMRAGAVDVSAVIDSALGTHVHGLMEKGILLDIDIQPDLPDIWGDAQAVRQMLLNLLANSAVFVEPGGCIAVSARREEGGALVITVADTGIGIAPDQLDYVLLPFVRPDHRLASGHGGPGLGLPVTKALMDLHDGHIDIKSTQGEGTEVTLVFPAHRLVEAGQGQGQTLLAG
jgi:signal transduction histidine kinase